jgi:hypothetical protein
MAEHSHGPAPAEKGSHHEATHASKNWLAHAKENLSAKKILGDIGLVLGSGFFVTLGSVLLPLSFTSSMMLGNPLPAIGALLSTGIGAAIGWQGVKNSPHSLEKTAFLGTQAAAVVAPTIVKAFGLPESVVPTAKIASLLSTALGMRHRPGGGHGH